MTEELKSRYKKKLECIRDTQEVVDMSKNVVFLTENDLKIMINATLSLMHEVEVLQERVKELEDGRSDQPKYSKRDSEPKYSKSDKKDSGYLSFLN